MVVHNPPKTEPQTLVRKLYKYLMTGALALGPIAITVYLLLVSFSFLDGILGTLTNFLIRNIIGFTGLGGKPIPGLGFISLILLLIVTGFALRQVFGQWMLTRLRKFLERIPLVNRVYRAVEQISEAIFSGQREVFKKAVLIEYPRKGIYSLGIMTSDTGGLIQSKLPEDSITVFLPTTPNPTSGYLLFVPKEDVIDIDISVEDALKLIISGGTVNAPHKGEIRIS